jgi:hypothetical protein
MKEESALFVVAVIASGIKGAMAQILPQTQKS